MRKHLSTILLVLVFILGLLIMLYPTVSNYYNVRMNSYVVTDYMTEVDNKTEEEYAQMFEEARAFNDLLPDDIQTFAKWEGFDEAYDDILNVMNGAIGYLKIDKINVNLAIYHGTDAATLQKYVGHLEGSSMPTGDVGNHTILTGHTGLPSAELLTNLTELELGDTFEIVVLNETFTYEIFNISVVEPDDLDILASIEDKDMVSLITCTPYGVNSHRLIVQGERILVDETVEDSTTENHGITIYNPNGIIWVVMAFEMLLFAIVGLVTWKNRRREPLSIEEKIENKFRRLETKERLSLEKDQEIKDKRHVKNRKKWESRRDKKKEV